MMTSTPGTQLSPYTANVVLDDALRMGHPEADEQGFRRDGASLTSERDVMSRCPEGSLVSGYEWDDGIGPRSERQLRDHQTPSNA